MSELYLDNFAEDGELIRPYDEIGVGVRVCYDKGALNRLSLAAARVSTAMDAFGNLQKYVVVDGNNFRKRDWFGLEIWWPDDCYLMEMRLRAYPCTHFKQRLYFNHDDYDGQYVDLDDARATDSFFTHSIYKEDLFNNNGVPRAAHNLRLNVMVPTSKWFVLGVMSIDRKRHG